MNCSKSGISSVRLKSGDYAVYLDRKRIGTIIRAEHHIQQIKGYAYVPAGQKRGTHGRIYTTLAQVLESFLLPISRDIK